MGNRRRPNVRSQQPPALRLTRRDVRILESIHTFDGLLSLKQIDRLFFSGLGRSQPRARMRLLFDHGYVAMPTAKTVHMVPWGETIYWLSQKGAHLVAGLRGENWRGFRWQRRPRMSQIRHHLAVNDFQICVREAVARQPHLELGEWISDLDFARDPDRINVSGDLEKKKMRIIRPDGYFSIIDTKSSKIYSYLLEIDMGTEDNPRFGREKVLPGLAYLKSEAYGKRFGTRYGRWLVVTTGERRVKNMVAQAERLGAKGKFLFTTKENIRAMRS